MAVLTKAQLLAQIAQLWPNNDNEEISEGDLRTVGINIIDSLPGLVLDAILIDPASVDGIELSKDVSVDGEITLGLAAVVAGAHGRYAAIIDNPDGDPADFSAASFTAAGAIMANSDTLATPDYSGASQFITLAFATPESAA